VAEVGCYLSDKPLAGAIVVTTGTMPISVRTGQYVRHRMHVLLKFAGANVWKTTT